MILNSANLRIIIKVVSKTNKIWLIFVTVTIKLLIFGMYVDTWFVCLTTIGGLVMANCDITIYSSDSGILPRDEFNCGAGLLVYTC